MADVNDGGPGDGGPGDGGGDFTWHGQVPEVLRGGIETYGDNAEGFAGLIKTYTHAQSMIGRDKVAIPADDDTEGWNNFFDATGRPATAEEYKLGLSDMELPEGMTLPEGNVKLIKTAAYEAGLSTRQASVLAQKLAKTDAERFTADGVARKERLASVDAALTEELGEAKAERLDLAKGVIGKYLTEDEAKDLIDALPLSFPLAKLMTAIAPEFKADELGPGGGRREMMTPSEAKTQIAKMRGDTKGPLNNKLHPDHQAALAKFEQLHELATAGLEK